MIDGLEVTGPLVSGNPAKMMQANIEHLMADIRDRGAEEVRRGFAAGEGGRQEVSGLGGRVADRVIGRVVARPSEGGRRWHASGVIQVYNEGLSGAQSRSLMAAASVLEGRSNIIRNATRRIGSQLRQIDLTKGFGED